MSELARVTSSGDAGGCQRVIANRIEALHSAPTSIASFALMPESFEATVSNVIFLGGDTDTLAAMAGALSGAYLGVGRLPERLVGLLLTSPKGRAYIQQLAGELFAAHQCGVLSPGVRAEGAAAPSPRRPSRLVLLFRPQHRGRSLCRRGRGLLPWWRRAAVAPRLTAALPRFQGFGCTARWPLQRTPGPLILLKS